MTNQEALSLLTILANINASGRVLLGDVKAACGAEWAAAEAAILRLNDEGAVNLFREDNTAAARGEETATIFLGPGAPRHVLRLARRRAR